MSFYIQSHIVKKGENLDMIAELHDISEVEILRYYHNQNCSIKNQIGKTVIPGQEILIPGQTEIDQIIFQRHNVYVEKHNKEINLLENGTLRPQLTKINNTYKVKITDSQKEEENVTEFKVDLKYLFTDEEGDSVISFNRKNYRINNNISQLKVYGLALKCVNCLNSAELKIDPKGNIKNIHNYRKILNLWEQEKQKLRNLYEDEYSLRYIDEFDYIVSSRLLLTRHIKRDLFLQFYFSSLYTKYNNGKAITESKLTMHEILYENTYDITLDDFIAVRHSGKCIDSRDQQEILARVEVGEEDRESEEENIYLPKSEISGNYTLNKENKILQKADVKIVSFFYEEEETTEIEIENIENS